ncbi:MAG TPA: hypothetical protein VF831_10245 [Anaerolineales bacterium]
MEPIPIEITCEGDCMHGRFFPAMGVENPVTMLFVPGWPADPEDFLGLGPRLSQQGINVTEMIPRGQQASEGIYTHFNALKDIGSTLTWLKQSGTQAPFKVDRAKLVLAGYSNGGGLAMAYAASDPGVRYLVSCAANDFGQFAREVVHHRTVAKNIRMEEVLGYLWSTQAPIGSVRFDPEPVLQELINHPDVFGLRENAGKLADRSILMFGGWEDQGPTIENYQLPLYRALKAKGAQKVTFIVYHTTHNFGNMRERLAADIVEWIHQQNFDDPTN